MTLGRNFQFQFFAAISLHQQHTQLQLYLTKLLDKNQQC
jgi:hypothetical protein